MRSFLASMMLALGSGMMFLSSLFYMLSGKCIRVAAKLDTEGCMKWIEHHDGKE